MTNWLLSAFRFVTYIKWYFLLKYPFSFQGILSVSKQITLSIRYNGILETFISIPQTFKRSRKCSNLQPYLELQMLSLRN